MFLLCEVSLGIKQSFKVGKEMWYFRMYIIARIGKNNLEITIGHVLTE